MKTFTLIFTSFMLTICLISCKQSSNAYQDLNEDNEDNVDLAEELIDYPDFGFMIPVKDYKGRVFKLSDNFPKKEPKADAALKEILSIDFKKDWEGYLAAVKDYVLEGNANLDYENSFFLEDNKKRNWYHVPWQHWGKTGREGFHGLTQEGPVGVQALAQSQKDTTHAYAVGFYNDLGGYTIGKVWSSATPNYSSLKTQGFPEGTVVAKLLFVPLTEDEVPYLKDPISWNAYIYKWDVPSVEISIKDSITRVQDKVNLIQMDIMVKDKRAIDTGGWVFGNFVYQGKLGNENRWNNLMPVGILWGDDPTNKLSQINPTPVRTIINSDLKETIINPSTDLPPMHLGWNSRLNGPVDDPTSSCMACHSTAQYPVISPILAQISKPPINVPENGTIASDAWMKWFRNVPCGEPFDPQATSFDYSLQLVKSIQNYIEYSSTLQKGSYYEDYWSDGNKIHRNVLVE